jgi:hypothetical protein
MAFDGDQYGAENRGVYSKNRVEILPGTIQEGNK